MNEFPMDLAALRAMVMSSHKQNEAKLKSGEKEDGEIEVEDGELSHDEAHETVPDSVVAEGAVPYMSGLYYSPELQAFSEQPYLQGRHGRPFARVPNETFDYSHPRIAASPAENYMYPSESPVGSSVDLFVRPAVADMSTQERTQAFLNSILAQSPAVSSPAFWAAEAPYAYAQQPPVVSVSTPSLSPVPTVDQLVEAMLQYQTQGFLDPALAALIAQQAPLSFLRYDLPAQPELQPAPGDAIIEEVDMDTDETDLRPISRADVAKLNQMQAAMAANAESVGMSVSSPPAAAQLLVVSPPPPPPTPTPTPAPAPAPAAPSPDPAPIVTAVHPPAGTHSTPNLTNSITTSIPTLRLKAPLPKPVPKTLPRVPQLIFTLDSDSDDDEEPSKSAPRAVPSPKASEQIEVLRQLIAKKEEERLKKVDMQKKRLESKRKVDDTPGEPTVAELQKKVKLKAPAKSIAPHAPPGTVTPPAPTPHRNSTPTTTASSSSSFTKAPEAKAPSEVSKTAIAALLSSLEQRQDVLKSQQHDVQSTEAYLSRLRSELKETDTKKATLDVRIRVMRDQLKALETMMESYTSETKLLSDQIHSTEARLKDKESEVRRLRQAIDRDNLQLMELKIEHQITDEVLKLNNGASANVRSGSAPLSTLSPPTPAPTSAPSSKPASKPSPTPASSKPAPSVSSPKPPTAIRAELAAKIAALRVRASANTKTTNSKPQAVSPPAPKVDVVKPKLANIKPQASLPPVALPSVASRPSFAPAEPTTSARLPSIVSFQLEATTSPSPFSKFQVPLRSSGATITPVHPTTSARIVPVNIFRARYASPLTRLRSYRLSPFFGDLCSLSSATFSNKINPNNIFCRFELHGVCNDDKCRWQHMRDLTLSDEELLLDLAAYYGLATGKPEVDPREFLELVRKENPGLPVATLAQRVVQYVRAHRVHPAYVSDRKRLFAPQPKCITEEAIRRSTSAPGARISTSNAEEEEEEDEEESGLLPQVDVPVGGLSADVDMREADFLPVAPTNVLMTDNSEARYYESSCLLPEEYERDLRQNPSTATLWLRYANEFVGGHFASEDAERDRNRALSILSRGLEANPACVDLWLRYLQLYALRSDSHAEVAELFATALRYNPTSFRLWQLYISTGSSFSARISVAGQALQALATKSDAPAESLHLLQLLLLFLRLYTDAGKAASLLELLAPMLASAIDALAREPQDSCTPLSDALPAAIALLSPEHLVILCLHYLYVSSFNASPPSSVDDEPRTFAIDWTQASEESRRKTEDTLSSLLLRPYSPKGAVGHMEPLILNWIALARVRDTDAAKNLAQTYLREDSSRIALWFAYADLLQESGEIRALFAGLQTRLPKHPELWYHEAQLWMQHSKRAEAVTALESSARSLCQMSASDPKTPKQLFFHVLGLPSDLSINHRVQRGSHAGNVFVWLSCALYTALSDSPNETEKVLQAALATLSGPPRLQVWWELFVWTKAQGAPDSRFLELLDRLFLELHTSHPHELEFVGRVLTLVAHIRKPYWELIYERALQLFPGSSSLVFRAIGLEIACGTVAKARKLYTLAVTALPYSRELFRSFYLFELRFADAGAAELVKTAALEKDIAWGS